MSPPLGSAHLFLCASPPLESAHLLRSGDLPVRLVHHLRVTTSWGLRNSSGAAIYRAAWFSGSHHGNFHKFKQKSSHNCLSVSLIHVFLGSFKASILHSHYDLSKMDKFVPSLPQFTIFILVQPRRVIDLRRCELLIVYSITVHHKCQISIMLLFTFCQTILETLYLSPSQRESASLRFAVKPKLIKLNLLRNLALKHTKILYWNK